MSWFSLSDILKKAQEKFPDFADRVKESKLFSEWEICVGKTIAKNCTPVGVRDRKLYLQVSHPAWRSELFLRKKEILKKIDEKYQLKFEDLQFTDSGFSGYSTLKKSKTKAKR